MDMLLERAHNPVHICVTFLVARFCRNGWLHPKVHTMFGRILLDIRQVCKILISYFTWAGQFWRPPTHTGFLDRPQWPTARQQNNFPSSMLSEGTDLIDIIQDWKNPTSGKIQNGLSFLDSSFRTQTLGPLLSTFSIMSNCTTFNNNSHI